MISVIWAVPREEIAEAARRHARNDVLCMGENLPRQCTDNRRIAKPRRVDTNLLRGDGMAGRLAPGRDPQASYRSSPPVLLRSAITLLIRVSILVLGPITMIEPSKRRLRGRRSRGVTARCLFWSYSGNAPSPRAVIPGLRGLGGTAAPAPARQQGPDGARAATAGGRLVHVDPRRCT